MGRKLRVDFSHEQKAADDDYTPVSDYPVADRV